MGILLDMDIENGNGGGRQVGGRQGGDIHIVRDMGVPGTRSLPTTRSPQKNPNPRNTLNLPSSLGPRGSLSPPTFLSPLSAPNLRRFLSLLEMIPTTCQMAISHAEDILNIPHMKELGMAIILDIIMTSENISGVHHGGLAMTDLQIIHHPGEAIPPAEGTTGHPGTTPIMNHLDVDITTLRVKVIVGDVISEDERNPTCADVSGPHTREATTTRLGVVVLHTKNLGMATLESIALIHHPNMEIPESPGTVTQTTHTIHTTHDSGIECLSTQMRFLGNGCEVLHGWEYSYFTLLRFILTELSYLEVRRPRSSG